MGSLGIQKKYLMSSIAILDVLFVEHLVLRIILCVVIGTLFIFFVFQLKKKQYHKIKMEHLAYNDNLCDCANIHKFKLDAQNYIEWNKEKQLVLLKFDINGFQFINQSLGMGAADRLLINISRSLKKIVASCGGCFGHASNDIFYLLMEYESAEKFEEIEEVFNRLLKKYLGDQFLYPIQLVVGQYLLQERNTDITIGIEKADIAHLEARIQGKHMCSYDKEFVRKALYRKEIERQMYDALATEQFQVYLQAQYDLMKESVTSAEALVRWKKEDGKMVMPDHFIPIFEENDFIIQLDMYIFEKVCAYISQRLKKNLIVLEISINFSRKHLSEKTFVSKLCGIADSYQVPHGLLVVELTETILGEVESVLLGIINELHKHGFRVAIDDFGVGYSALGMLKNIPVDILKIDRSFFVNNKSNDRAELLLIGVLDIAKNLKLKTVAEGIEEAEQVEFLKKHGCNLVQGYYYARPVPIDEFWKQKIMIENSPE